MVPEYGMNGSNAGVDKVDADHVPKPQGRKERNRLLMAFPARLDGVYPASFQFL